jgi:hypothetical protein
MLKKSISVAAIIIFSATLSCSKQDIQPSKVVISSSEKNSNIQNKSILEPGREFTKFSEKELFLGIFFLDGEITNYVTSLVNLRESLNSGDLQILSDRGQNMIAFIEENRPNFFVEFAKFLQTGDHQQILEGLNFAENTLIELEVSNGQSSPVIQGLQELQGGKNCHKWIIINHFLIKRRLGIISSNPNNSQVPDVLLEKEILVNDLVVAIKG